MFRTLLVTVTSCLLLVRVAACGGGGMDAEGYDTYQECFDDHHVNESLSVHDSIVVCCLDHPIAGMTHACLTTAPDCVTYLGANLATASATPAEVMTSCADYITELDMQ